MELSYPHRGIIMENLDWTLITVSKFTVEVEMNPLKTLTINLLKLCATVSFRK